MGSKYTLEKNEVRRASHALTDEDSQLFEFSDEGHPGAIRLERLEDPLPCPSDNCNSIIKRELIN